MIVDFVVIGVTIQTLLDFLENFTILSVKDVVVNRVPMFNGVKSFINLSTDFLKV